MLADIGIKEGHAKRALDSVKEHLDTKYGIVLQQPAYIEDISEIHRTEPYVYSQMIAGKDAPKRGEAKNSWLTGTAAWTFANVSQYILGIQPEYRGLVVDPCIPKRLKEFKVNRTFRGCKFSITVTNPDGVEKGIKSITMNGKRIEGNCIALESGVTDYDVSVIMGI